MCGWLSGSRSASNSARSLALSSDTLYFQFFSLNKAGDKADHHPNFQHVNPTLRRGPDGVLWCPPLTATPSGDWAVVFTHPCLSLANMVKERGSESQWASNHLLYKSPTSLTTLFALKKKFPLLFQSSKHIIWDDLWTWPHQHMLTLFQFFLSLPPSLPPSLPLNNCYYDDDDYDSI